MAGNIDDGFGDFMKRAQGSGGQDGFLNGVLTAPTFADLKADAGPKSKKKKKKDGEADDTEDEEEEPAAKKNGASDKPQDDDWFDEIKVRKAERVFAAKVQSQKSGLEAQQTVMAKHLREFLANKDFAINFKQEIATVEFRRKWLAALTAESTEPLTTLMEQEQKRSKEDQASGKSDGATSRDQASVHRAGPCNNWAKLKHTSEVTKHIPGSKMCETAAALTLWSAGCDTIFDSWFVLLKSCRSAVSDLLSAKSNADSVAKRAEDKKADEAKRAQQAASGGKQIRKRPVKSASGIALLDLDFVSSVGTPVPSSDGILPSGDANGPAVLRTPALISNCGWVGEKVKASKAMHFVLCVLFTFVMHRFAISNCTYLQMVFELPLLLARLHLNTRNKSACVPCS